MIFIFVCLFKDFQPLPNDFAVLAMAAEIVALRPSFVLLPRKFPEIIHGDKEKYEGVSKSFRTDRLWREQQMVQLSATRCSCIAIL
jgi:hypothetical protein